MGKGADIKTAGAKKTIDRCVDGLSDGGAACRGCRDGHFGGLRVVDVDLQLASAVHIDISHSRVAYNKGLLDIPKAAWAVDDDVALRAGFGLATTPALSKDAPEAALEVTLPPLAIVSVSTTLAPV